MKSLLTNVATTLEPLVVANANASGTADTIAGGLQWLIAGGGALLAVWGIVKLLKQEGKVIPKGKWKVLG